MLIYILTFVYKFLNTCGITMYLPSYLWKWTKNIVIARHSRLTILLFYKFFSSYILKELSMNNERSAPNQLTYLGMCGKHIWITINFTVQMKIMNFQLFRLMKSSTLYPNLPRWIIALDRKSTEIYNTSLEKGYERCKVTGEWGNTKQMWKKKHILNH